MQVVVKHNNSSSSTSVGNYSTIMANGTNSVDDAIARSKEQAQCQFILRNFDRAILHSINTLRLLSGLAPLKSIHTNNKNNNSSSTVIKILQEIRESITSNNNNAAAIDVGSISIIIQSLFELQLLKEAEAVFPTLFPTTTTFAANAIPIDLVYIHIQLLIFLGKLEEVTSLLQHYQTVGSFTESELKPLHELLQKKKKKEDMEIARRRKQEESNKARREEERQQQQQQQQAALSSSTNNNNNNNTEQRRTTVSPPPTTTSTTPTQQQPMNINGTSTAASYASQSTKTINTTAARGGGGFRSMLKYVSTLVRGYFKNKGHLLFPALIGVSFVFLFAATVTQHLPEQTKKSMYASISDFFTMAFTAWRY